MRDMESSFQKEEVQPFEGQVEVKTEISVSSLCSQQDERLDIKLETEDSKNDYTLKQGITCTVLSQVPDSV